MSRFGLALPALVLLGAASLPEDASALANYRITALSVSPTSAQAGGTVNVTWTVTNSGTTTGARTIYQRFYLSTDATITTADTYLGLQHEWPAGMPVGWTGTVTRAITIPIGTVAGRYYIGSIIDYSNLEVETNETDNTRATLFDVATDLLMNAWTSPATAVGYGSSVTVGFSVRNASTTSAGPFTVSFYYGDSTATTGLTLMGNYVFTGGLGGGITSSTITQTYALPPVVANGTRYIHYFIDSTAAIIETNEYNNRGYRAISITGLPDLQVTTLAVSPATQVPGGLLTVTYRIANAGSTRTMAAFPLRFYYSDDATITTGDYYLAVEVTVGAGLNAGAYYPGASTGTVTVTVPSTATVGARYVGAIVDSNNSIAESNETNNTRAAAFTVTASTGTACTAPSQCATGFCVDGMCCNTACGGGTTDCEACSRAAGAAVDGTCGPRTAGLSCGSGTDTVCNNPDTCNATGTCLPNNEPTTTECRADAGDCDVADFCDGAGSCPADAFEPAGTVCGDSSDTVCDNPDSCNAGGVCLSNNEPTTTICRADAGDCDVAEYCDVGGNCPVDAFVAAGTACGDSTDTLCTDPDTCDAAGTCLANNAPTTTSCRAAAGACDVAEFCDTYGVCPADAFADVGTACGDGSDTVCTDPDTCDGSGACLENHASATTECRADAGDCDVAELCDGAGACPADVFEASGTACGDATEATCNHADTCNDAGVCLDNFAATDVECRADAGDCDVAELCDGAGACPADAFEAAGLPCGTLTADPCSAEDTCDGAGLCLPNHAGTEIICRDSVDDCDAIEYCDGVGLCPDDAAVADGTVCDDDNLCTTTECQAGVCTVTTTTEGCCVEHGDCDVPFELCASDTCVEALCRTCTTDADCGVEGNVCMTLSSGDYCGVACDPATTGSCPMGYSCEDVDGDDLCVPEAGDCVCTTHSYQACDDGDLTWFDSCGAAEDVAADCEGRGCVADACCPTGTHLEGDACVEDSAEGADGDADADADADGTGDMIEDGADADLPPSDGGEGCGCRAVGGSSTDGLLAALLAAFGLALIRRRRS